MWTLHGLHCVDLIEPESIAHNALFLFELYDSCKIDFRVRVRKTASTGVSHTLEVLCLCSEKEW